MEEGGFCDDKYHALPIPDVLRHTMGYDQPSGKERSVCPSLFMSLH